MNRKGAQTDRGLGYRWPDKPDGDITRVQATSDQEYRHQKKICTNGQRTGVPVIREKGVARAKEHGYKEARE
jgi:hypothetical protein